ncbi:MAG: RDD family protein [Puniceicoccales bacterium]|nr:RDD family protein [Puniceicoccales bacterium]
MRKIQPAPFPGRILAYLLDVILALLLAITFLLWWVYPRFHAESWALLQGLGREGTTASEFLSQLPDESRALLIKMLIATQLTITATLIAYFWLSELLSRGSSLGKCMFRLRVVDGGGERPGGGALLLRSAISSICLTVSSLLLLPNFLWGLFRKDHRCWHDLLSGSRVERY